MRYILMLVLLLSIPAHASDLPTPASFSSAEWSTYLSRGKTFARDLTAKYKVKFDLKKNSLTPTEFKCLTMRIVKFLVEEAAYHSLVDSVPLGKKIEFAQKGREVMERVKEACDDGDGGGRGNAIADAWETEYKAAKAHSGQVKKLVSDSDFWDSLLDSIKASAYIAFYPQLNTLEKTKTLLTDPEKADRPTKQAAAIMSLATSVYLLRPGISPGQAGQEVFTLMPIPTGE